MFTLKTVRKQAAKRTTPAYTKEIKERLALIEKDVIKKKIKLLDILDKLE